MKALLKYTFTLMFAIALLFLNFKIWNKNSTLKMENEKLQIELKIKQEQAYTLSETNKHKKEKLDVITTSSKDIVEEKARNVFGMVGEGETYYHTEE